MLLLSIISGILRAERFIQPECELIRRILRKSTCVSLPTLGRLPRSKVIFLTSRSLCHAYRSLQSRASAGGKENGLSKEVYSALNGATIDALQKLNYDRMQETHVLGTAYRKTIHAEMTDHFRYVLERLAELSQDVSVQLLVLLDAHMHEAAGAPETITTM